MTKRVIAWVNRFSARYNGWIQTSPDIFQVPNLYPLYEMDAKENTGWTETDVSDMHFHDDYGWFMPVLEKILNEGYKMVLTSESFMIYDPGTPTRKPCVYASVFVKEGEIKEAYALLIYNFLNTYYQQIDR